MFQDDAKWQWFVETLSQACLKTGWHVDSVMPMPNHFHLVREPPEPNLVAGIKWLLGSYIEHSLAWDRCSAVRQSGSRGPKTLRYVSLAALLKWA